jgi:hypothetical protein
MTDIQTAVQAERRLCHIESSIEKLIEEINKNRTLIVNLASTADLQIIDEPLLAAIGDEVEGDDDEGDDEESGMGFHGATK